MIRGDGATRDASCAILDAQGRVVAQHTVLPLHLGAFPACAEGLFQFYQPGDMAEGDAFLVNHPYFGGSPHASIEPDICCSAPDSSSARAAAARWLYLRFSSGGISPNVLPVPGTRKIGS